MSPDLWQLGCDRLAAELPEQQFNTWIRPLPAADITDDGADGAVAQVRVPNRFKLDWIRSQYAHRIENILSELAGKPVRLELAIAQRDVPAGRPVPLSANGPVRAAALLNTAAMAHATRVQPVGGEPSANDVAVDAHRAAINGGGSVQQGLPSGPAPGHHLPPAAHSHKLNTALTFDTLVPGRANQMARTAALHVAGAPGVMYNPLFIYGGVGLGKTHLIHAVGNALLRDKPDARVLYLHAEQFISDVVKNYQRKTFDELKAKYHSLDLLLIDDVQFFAGKDRTQEEFFNAFEALLAKRAHIIMTSDTYPKGLVDIDERL
ncbi:MAG: chromosomal replication initiation protein DnaA, partial [Burkholderiales bacterium PBB5]